MPPVSWGDVPDEPRWPHCCHLPAAAPRVSTRRERRTRRKGARRRRAPSTCTTCGPATRLVRPWPLYQAYRRRERPQYGETAGFFYFVHGIGCKVRDASGEKVFPCRRARRSRAVHLARPALGQGLPEGLPWRCQPHEYGTYRARDKTGPDDGEPCRPDRPVSGALGRCCCRHSRPSGYPGTIPYRASPYRASPPSPTAGSA